MFEPYANLRGFEGLVSVLLLQLALLSDDGHVLQVIGQQPRTLNPKSFGHLLDLGGRNTPAEVGAKFFQNFRTLHPKSSLSFCSHLQRSLRCQDPQHLPILVAVLMAGAQEPKRLQSSPGGPGNVRRAARSGAG